PDGDFSQIFDYAAVKATGNLQVHWASKNSGGDRKGNILSPTWENGKQSTQNCMGIIICDEENCHVIIQPQTTPQGIANQLLQQCSCGAQLLHQPCSVRSILWTFMGGIYYSNVPGLKTPGESIADISTVLLNADHVRKEKQKVKKADIQGGDSFVSAFAKFSAEHKGFVIHSKLDEVTVISLQTPFMRSQLIKDYILDEPVNGLVSDAAHGWWQERTSLLIISSCYSSELLCWVPGVFSCSNGASAEHYKYHFLAVFYSMANEASDRQIEIFDRIFAGVVDFSEAECVGFCLAFVEFWLSQPDHNRTEKELQKASEKLLRGCVQHFQAGVTHIKKISGVVPPGLADAFEA
ncbi:hypothetical protein BDQ12DRAFT_608068, partial [Crucibulum laeve]